MCLGVVCGRRDRFECFLYSEGGLGEMEFRGSRKFRVPFTGRRGLGRDLWRTEEEHPERTGSECEYLTPLLRPIVGGGEGSGEDPTF